MQRKSTIEEMNEIAKKRGGKCLSEKYTNNKTKLKWQCSKGHVWEATTNSVKRGSWCPICRHKEGADKQRNTIEDMKKLAKSKGGECLSTAYVNNKTKLKWKCHKSHIFHMKPNAVSSGQWCPVCANEKRKLTGRYSIEMMEDIANKRDGKCLSNTYENSQTKLKWQCEEGHIWEAKPYSVIAGHWCPYCANRKKLTIKQMEKIAKERGGKCLSSEYIGNHKNLTWQCSEGHIWKATPHSVKQGTWCPYCSNRTKLGERITRAYFELIFNEKFPKKRPNWLKNEQGLKLELDGFCSKLKLAFEYQGIQHFEEHKWFHQKRDFKQQKKLDVLKEKLCFKNNVVLIAIPYNVEHKEIQRYIVKECKKKNVDIPEKINFVSYKSLGVYSLNLLNEMKKIAKERGGKCLSTEYIDSETKLKWQCKEGHVWKAISKSVKRGSWCPVCGRIDTANKLRGNIVEMRKLAERKGVNAFLKST